MSKQDLAKEEYEQVKENEAPEQEQIATSSAPPGTSTASIPIARAGTSAVSAPVAVAGSSSRGHRMSDETECSGGEEDSNRLDEQLLNKYPKYATLSSSLPTNPANRYLANVRRSEMHHPVLHFSSCEESAEDLRRMKYMLSEDPNCLNRRQQSSMKHGTLVYFSSTKLPPVHDAIRAGHRQCVEFLIDNGAVIDDGRPMSVLESLYRSLYLTPDVREEILEYLLRKGVSPNVVFPGDACGTPLCKAVISNSMTEVKLLLKHGAKLNVVQNSQEYSPELEEALVRFHLDIAKVLLLHGAQLSSHVDKKPTLQSWPSLHKILGICILSMEDGTFSAKVAAEKFIKCAKMYKQFGGNVWAILHEEYHPMDIVSYLDNCRVPEFVEAVRPVLEELIVKPLRLQDLVRISIRNSMGRNYVTDVDELTLPKDLKKYLRFEDVEV